MSQVRSPAKFLFSGLERMPVVVVYFLGRRWGYREVAAINSLDEPWGLLTPSDSDVGMVL